MVRLNAYGIEQPDLPDYWHMQKHGCATLRLTGAWHVRHDY